MKKQFIEEEELLNTVDMKEGEVDSSDDEKQVDTEVDPQATDIISTSKMVEASPAEELQGMEKLTQKLMNLQQGIEDAVLRRAKNRMDAELEQVLGKQSDDNANPGLEANVPRESDEKQPLTIPE